MVEVLIPLFAFLQFYTVVHWDSKAHNSASSVSLLIIIRSGRLAEIRLSTWMSESYCSLCGIFSKTEDGLCIYYLFLLSNLNFFHNSQWMTLHTSICLVLYSLCTNSLHSLIYWSFRLYYRITYICCFVASYLFSLWYGWSLWHWFVLQ